MSVFGYLGLDGKAFILWFPTVAAFLLKDHADIHKLLTRPDACDASKHGHAACANNIIDNAEHNMMSILFVLPSECTSKLNSDEKPIKDQKMKVNMLEVHIKDTMCGPPKKPVKKDQMFSPGYFDFRCLGTQLKYLNVRTIWTLMRALIIISKVGTLAMPTQMPTPITMPITMQ